MTTCHSRNTKSALLTDELIRNYLQSSRLLLISDPGFRRFSGRTVRDIA